MSQREILLALSTSRYSRHLVEHALDEARRFRSAKDDVKLDVLYVIEDQALERVERMVGDEGFLGLSMQKEVMSVLGDEHHRTALRRVAEIQGQVAPLGIPISVEEIRGEFEEALVERAESKHYDVILITRAERPFITRFLFGSQDDKVARLFREENLGRLIIDEA